MHITEACSSPSIEGVELINDHLVELNWREVVIQKGWDVVQFESIGNGNHRPLSYPHGKRLIIAAPVAHVLHALLSEDVQRRKSLLKRRR